MAVVGFFRRGGRVIPIIKRAVKQVTAPIRSSGALKRATDAVGRSNAKMNKFYTNAEEAMKYGEKFSPNFPKATASYVGDANRQIHEMRKYEPIHKSIIRKRNKIANINKAVKKRTFKVAQASALAGIGGATAYVGYKRMNK